MFHVRRAFTLIELLIVVAIIAILAAIAVPNFLEAQVRGKVARAKSDIRSLVGALEAYRVDNNAYIDGEGFTNVADNTKNGTASFCHIYLLSTPVAYMASLPNDMPFGSWVSPWWGQQTGHGYLYWGGDWFLSHQKMHYPGVYIEEWLGSRYALTAIGPSKIYSSTPTDRRIEPYDPSNGTRSTGDLFYPQATRFYTSFN